MRRSFYGAGLCGAAFACCVCAAAAEIERVVRQNEPAAVVVLGDRPGRGTVQGSGCFVDADGTVLTSLHQVDGFEQLCIIRSDGNRHDASVLAVDRDHDLALLKTGARPARWAWLGETAAIQSGAAIVAIAAPENLQFSTVAGIVSNPNRTYKGMRVIQADLPAEPGSSGGPVFDADGALIGCIVGRLENQPWVTVVNPVENAYALLNANGIAAPGRRMADMILGQDEIVPAPGISPLHRQAVEAYNRGVTATAAGDKIAAYGAAVKLLPDFYEAWFNLAVASATAGRTEDAVAAYRAAQKIRPHTLEVPHNLGRVFLGLGRFEEALNTFAQAVELAPESPSAQNDLGEACRRLGRINEARDAFQAALRLQPDYAPALYNLALLHAQAGHRAEAARLFRAYLDAAPGATDAPQIRNWLRSLQDPEP